MSGIRGLKSIPRISAEHWHGLVEHGDVGRKPLVVSGAFEATEAVKNWTPSHLAERFADRRIVASVDLPMAGSPYEKTSRGHQRAMTIADFFHYLPDHPGTYLAQAPIGKFPGLAEELGIHDEVVSPMKGQNLWVGNATRSGLHFDLSDGLLVQIHGVKSATLVEAGHFANVYPFPDVHLKSRVDPDAVDEQAFPKFAEIDRHVATLQPGDALYIPRLWWHHLVSADISISVNAWFGHSPSSDMAATILRAGPAVWGQMGRDFVSLGILKRDFHRRLFAAKPNGLRLYETLVRSNRR